MITMKTSDARGTLSLREAERDLLTHVESDVCASFFCNGLYIK